MRAVRMSPHGLSAGKAALAHARLQPDRKQDGRPQPSAA